MHLLLFLLVIWLLASCLPQLMGCLGRVLLILAALAILGYVTHGMH